MVDYVSHIAELSEGFVTLPCIVAMAFAVAVEMSNIRVRMRAAKPRWHSAYATSSDPDK